MTDEANLKRVNLRMNAEDVAWLVEQAEDEGVEYTTLIRMIVNRLRRGRPPLVSMMTGGAPRRIPASPQYDPSYFAVAEGTPPNPIDPALAEDVLQSRLQELETMPVAPSPADEAEVVAIPLRRVGREQYNPGRR